MSNIDMGTSRLLCHLEPSPLGTKLGAYTLARKLATVSPLDLLRKDVIPFGSRLRLVRFRFRGHRTLKKKTESRPSSLNIVGRSDPPTHLKEGAKPL